MQNYPKLIIYFKPDIGEIGRVLGLSLTFSRLNYADNTYKQKTILEKTTRYGEHVEKKVTEFHIGAKEIMDKILLIDFDREYDKAICNDKTHSYYLIQYGDKKILTSNKEQIQYILDMFRFDEILTVSYKHYQYIPNVYEYMDLMRILNNKIGELNGEQLATLSHFLSDGNPYTVFQSMAWLDKFLDDQKKQ